MCVDASPYRVTGAGSGLEPYRIYRVVFQIENSIGLEGLPHSQTIQGAFRMSRFVDVTDWSEDDKKINRI